MQIYNIPLLGLVPMLSIFASARPQFGSYADDNDLVLQQSRVTAFMITDNGPVVECWSVGEMLPDAQILRSDGSKGRSRRMHMFSDSDIDDVGILTWPAFTSIWPPPDKKAVQATAPIDASKPSTFTLSQGIVQIEVHDNVGAADNEPEAFYFSAENGDDWFYFEDTTDSSWESKQCAGKSAASPPIKMRTVTGAESTLIEFKHFKAPQHKVLHKGACTFAGLVDEQPSKRGSGFTRAGHRQAPMQQE